MFRNPRHPVVKITYFTCGLLTILLIMLAASGCNTMALAAKGASRDLDEWTRGYSQNHNQQGFTEAENRYYPPTAQRTHN